jgi:hypothetical protein
MLAPPGNLCQTPTHTIAEPTKQGSPHHWTFPRCTSVRDLHTAFNLLYVYDYITTRCRQQADVIQNHENEHIRSIEKGEAKQKI